jgi:hypothetical protein
VARHQAAADGERWAGGCGGFMTREIPTIRRRNQLRMVRVRIELPCAPRARGAIPLFEISPPVLCYRSPLGFLEGGPVTSGSVSHSNKKLAHSIKIAMLISYSIFFCT